MCHHVDRHEWEGVVEELGEQRARAAEDGERDDSEADDREEEAEEPVAPAGD
ncbi:MAG: hypothetical protein ABEJ79_12065 [Halolamina sp.]